MAASTKRATGPRRRARYADQAECASQQRRSRAEVQRVRESRRGRRPPAMQPGVGDGTARASRVPGTAWPRRPTAVRAGSRPAVRKGQSTRRTRGERRGGAERDRAARRSGRCTRRRRRRQGRTNRCQPPAETLWIGGGLDAEASTAGPRTGGQQQRDHRRLVRIEVAIDVHAIGVPRCASPASPRVDTATDPRGPHEDRIVDDERAAIDQALGGGEVLAVVPTARVVCGRRTTPPPTATNNHGPVGEPHRGRGPVGEVENNKRHRARLTGCCASQE